MKWFKSDPVVSSNPTPPEHGGERGLLLDKRQLSRIASAIIIILFCVFVAGYYLGKRTALQEFSQAVEQGSFSDHIFSSMCSMYEAKDEPSGEEAEVSDVTEQQAPAEVAPVDTPDAAESAVKNTVQPVADEAAQVAESSAIHQKYYAQLAGFGTQQAAQKLTQRLAQRGITTHVKKRPGKTPKGRKTTWYQVVTPTYNDKEELTQITGLIQRLEHIKDIRIVNA